MSWTAYQVALRVLSPIHIGAAKLGNLQTTRPYVHGKAIWGGLTARLTRDNYGFDGNYAVVGERVHEEMAFSYFYPTTGQEVQLWPWDDPDQFAWRYLGSYTSTALNYSQNNAQEGSLHEVEFIAPTTREGQPVYLTGYIFILNGCLLPWQQALGRLQLGGERTYGWGRLALCHPLQQTNRLFNRYDMQLNDSRPWFLLDTEDHLLAHTVANGLPTMNVRGRLVPIVARETVDANAHGRRISFTSVCWEPGGKVMAPTRLFINRNGMWERYDA